MPQEGKQVRRWFRMLGNRGRLQIALEGLEHEFQFGCGSLSLGYGVGVKGPGRWASICIRQIVLLLSMSYKPAVEMRTYWGPQVTQVLRAVRRQPILAVIACAYMIG